MNSDEGANRSAGGRAIAVEDLAVRIAGMSLGRPVRVAIDGRTASGKTTLADELADRLRRQGRSVIRTSVDGFHRPKAERYARGRRSAEGYYYESRDLTAVRALLLDPLGPGGDRLYRTASFDLAMDRPIEQEPLTASADAILILDGTFLQRPELRDGWDVTIFVKTSDDVAERRGVRRDAALLGGAEAAGRLYSERYGPACDLYERLCAPASIADAIFHNDDVRHPQVSVRPDGRLASRRND
jgi:uridine kinase